MIRLEQVTKVYRTDRIETTALDGISVDVEKGNAKQHLDEAAAEATTYLKSAGYPVG